MFERERERGGVIPSDFFNLSNAFLPFLCEIAKKINIRILRRRVKKKKAI